MATKKRSRRANDIFPSAAAPAQSIHVFYSNIQIPSNALVFNIYFLASTACWTAAAVPAGRWTGSLGTTTSSNSSWEMAVMVYVSAGGSARAHSGGSGGRTDSNDEGADCEAGDCVFDQVRGAGSQQGGRGAHAGVIVGRLERFAAGVRTRRQRSRQRRHSLSHGGGGSTDLYWGLFSRRRGAEAERVGLARRPDQRTAGEETASSRWLTLALTRRCPVYEYLPRLTTPTLAHAHTHTRTRALPLPSHPPTHTTPLHLHLRPLDRALPLQGMPT